MAYVSYPSVLPPPETGPFTRVRSTRQSDISAGTRQYALIERAFRGQQEVTFLFGPQQAYDFRDFWLNTLLRGGIWFTTEWPIPSGWFDPLGVRKFISVPQWTHIGNGAWRVRAVTELVLTTDVPSLVYTSKTFPIMVIEAMDIVHSVNGATMYTWEPLQVDFVHEVTGGILKDVLSAYEDWPPEGVEFTLHSLTGGELKDVLLFYDMGDDAMEMLHSLIGGELHVVMLFYTNWPTESMDIAHSLTGGVLS